MLFREGSSEAPTAPVTAATPLPPGSGVTPGAGWLRRWLISAGMTDASAPSRFVLWMIGAALSAAFAYSFVLPRCQMVVVAAFVF